MKKLLMGILGTVIAFSLVACTPTKVNDAGKGETITVEETLENGETITTTKELPGGVTPDMIVRETADPAAERPVDPNAVKLENIMVYYTNEAGNGLASEMVDVEMMNEEVILEQLIDFGVLPSEVEINSFEVEGGIRPGPGVDPSEAGDGGERIGTLDLTQLDTLEGLDEKLMVYSIVNTFCENYELDKFQILINGEVYDTSLSTDGYIYPIEKYDEIS